MERIPILRLNGFLLVTIQVELHDELVMSLQDDLSQMLSKTHATGVLIDTSGLEIVDSFVGRALGQIALVARMMDAVTVLVGMKPAVAITLIELGVTLRGIRTALNVDKGMELLSEAVGVPGSGAIDPLLTPQVVEIRTALQLSVARSLVRDLTLRLGFSLVESTKFVTAASELGRNVLVHGAGGTMTIAQVERAGHCGVRLVFVDQGCGIADIELALTDGFSTRKSMGMGLGGARRLVNEFAITSVPGAGTTVTVTQWKRR